eukprot:CAMPEP_0183300010 /NCGR_PEP_ID=MMETSP0160_2-20130417/6573_1 /TAXON_ID=2839 ORGANISM="Odontella Sinensis, Strain Grunow 1884" /NCGR_SAMPLE_ID=MMETSP0160_2 /ASSEMBLY_ACC=CAM_ASM_000250 /LENGTH=96 /DNA_ID=CAMNT_0025462355 /DNA_START=30 /DNA_END=320 /DNA_ORIENTATION=-
MSAFPPHPALPRLDPSALHPISALASLAPYPEPESEIGRMRRDNTRYLLRRRQRWKMGNGGSAVCICNAAPHHATVAELAEGPGGRKQRGWARACP